MVSAGELSGDEHAALLAAALKRKIGDKIELFGMGGQALRGAGCETFVDSEKEASVMGFVDVALNIRKIFAALALLKRVCQERRPDLLVLVDFPDFNLRLAKFAHGLGIKTFYFIPPSVWAWREGRIKTIAKYIDAAGLIYPFEEKFYVAHGYNNAKFIGHPFCSKFDATPFTLKDRVQFCERHELNPKRPIFALFPGSRTKEIDRHMEILKEASIRFVAKHPEVQIVVSLAKNLPSELLGNIIKAAPHLKLISDDPFSVMRSSDAALLKSGTSNLEAAFAGLPFSMFFKTGLLSEIIVRAMVRTKEYSIVNLIRSGTVRELVQRAVSPANLVQEMEELLFNDARRLEIKTGLSEVVSALRREAEVSAYDKAANICDSLLPASRAEP